MEKNKTLKYLREVSGKTKINIAMLTLIHILLGVCGVLYALCLRNIINSAVDGQKSDFWAAVIEFVSLLAFQITLSAVNRHLDELTKSALENRFKQRLCRTLLDRDFSAVSAVHSGDWLNRLTSDTAVASNGLTSIIPTVSGMIVRLIGAVIMIITLEPKFCFLVIPAGILLLLTSFVFRKKLKLLHKNVQEKDGSLRTFLQDILGSLLVVRSYAAENAVLDSAEDKMIGHKAARMKKNRFSNICNIGFGIVMNGAYVLGAVFCGYGILTETMTYGTFTAVLQLVGQVQSPFANISGFLPQWYAMLASAERLMYAENFIPQGAENAMPVDEILKRYNSDFKAVGLEKAYFTYQPIEKDTEMPVVLENVSIEIKKGEYIAFIGQSGCGKSTVMKLMMSLYRFDSGERYIICGDEKQPLSAEWQRLFAYVPQGNHLISGTIREIVSFADASRKNDDTAIIKALETACADFVSDFEKGIDTLLGEHGQGLSEGQMQRIAIARAIFSRCPVLLLDESTSALDEQTEKRLIENLRSFTDKTVIIVTHRPAVLGICDRVIEFTENGLKEAGNDRD